MCTFYQIQLAATHESTHCAICIINLFAVEFKTSKYTSLSGFIELLLDLAVSFLYDVTERKRGDSVIDETSNVLSDNYCWVRVCDVGPPIESIRTNEEFFFRVFSQINSCYILYIRLASWDVRTVRPVRSNYL